jgi:Kef-type K+ transport system membrane component KefB
MNNYLKPEPGNMTISHPTPSLPHNYQSRRRFLISSSLLPGRIISLAIATCLFLISSEVFAGGAPTEGHGLGLVSAIGLAIVCACSVAILFNYMKVPALLAYIVSGLMLTFFASNLISSSLEIITHISHLGLVFLLFIIGLEMDLSGILRMGFRTALAVLLQGPVAIAAVLAVQYGADALGIVLPGLGSTHQAFFYFAVACALGSTAVAVKLLGDQFDLGSKAGKITVLTLIAEDICAVGALSYVQSQTNTVGGQGYGMAVTICGGIVLAVALILVAKFILRRIMTRFSKSPDMLALIAIGWCFLCAESISRVGLSAEMGALIAGLTVGRLPQHIEILSKVSSLRDFFMALFFVALGMTLPLPTVAVMGQALALVAIVVISRILLFAPTLLWAKNGIIVSLTAAINLSQLSEFTLLLIPIGISGGALTIEQGMVISYALMLSVVLTGFTIKYNYRIAMALTRVLGKSKKVVDEDQTADSEYAGHGNGPDIVMLGYFLNAEELASEIRDKHPELLSRILVIDFNLQSHSRIKKLGFNVAYGDIGNLDTLRHHGIAHAKIILSTISNSFLRGITNQELVEEIKKINPTARVIATADREEDVSELRRLGAFRAISVSRCAAPAYLTAIEDALLTDHA